jgi:hypothetical protein
LNFCNRINTKDYTWSRENIRKYFPASIKLSSDALEHILTINCHDLHLIALLFIYFPHYFFPVEPETAVDPCDCITEDPVSSVEQPGKQNPLDHSDIAYSLSLLHALGSGSDMLFGRTYYDA